VADRLTDAEQLCHQTLQAIEAYATLPSDARDAVQKGLHGLLPVLAESKRKVMVRSAQGQRLAQAIVDSASKLHDVVSQPQPTGSPVDEVLIRLESVRESVKKLEIYWQSFEYVTT